MSDLFGVWHFPFRLFVHFVGSCLLALPLFFLFPYSFTFASTDNPIARKNHFYCLRFWIWKPNYLKWESYTIINFIPSSFLFMSVCHSFVATVWLENSILTFFMCVACRSVYPCVCVDAGVKHQSWVAFTFLVRHLASISKLTILVTHNQINRSELCIPWISYLVCMYISENLLLDTVVFSYFYS